MWKTIFEWKSILYVSVVWQIKDYSGNYHVMLVPCTTSIDQEYSLPLECHPREPVPFDLQIRFQQISDPVPEEYSLNTQFHLLKKKELWLSDGSLGFGQGSDASFTEGLCYMTSACMESLLCLHEWIKCSPPHMLAVTLNTQRFIHNTLGTNIANGHTGKWTL